MLSIPLCSDSKDTAVSHRSPFKASFPLSSHPFLSFSSHPGYLHLNLQGTRSKHTKTLLHPYSLLPPSLSLPSLLFYFHPSPSPSASGWLPVLPQPTTKPQRHTVSVDLWWPSLACSNTGCWTSRNVSRRDSCFLYQISAPWFRMLSNASLAVSTHHPRSLS